MRTEEENFFSLSGKYNDVGPMDIAGKHRQIRAASIAYFLLLLTRLYGQSLDFGASPNKVGSGARAMGQGNAFIAVADDATAVSWNPAGVAQLEKPEVSFAVEYLSRRADMGVAGHPESSDMREESLSDLNYFSMAYPVRLLGRHAVISLNYLRQYRFDQQFSIEHVDARPMSFIGWPGVMTEDEDYDLEIEGDLATLSPALAVELTDRLSLGLAVNIWDDDITGASHYTKELVYHSDGTWVSAPPLSLVVPMGASDVIFKNEYRVTKGFSFAFGGLYRISREWSVGTVVKPAYKLYLEDVLYTINPSTNFVRRDRYNNVLEFPWSVGTGVAWRPSDELTVSTDVTWTQWSKYRLFDERLNSEFNPLNPLTGHSIHEHECDDTISARLGMEYLIIRDKSVIPLRCGIGYDPSPAIDQVDEYYTASVGAGYQRGRYMLDVGYEVRWGHDVVGGGSKIPGTAEDVIRQRVLLSLIVYLGD